MITTSQSSPMRLLILKAVQAGHFKHSGKYYLLNGRWHKLHQDQPAPKGAPVAAHPHAAGQHAPVKHFTDDEWKQLELPPENVNSGTYNKQLGKLKEMSDAGHVTGILGHGYGSNTYGKKLATIANHLLALHGSQHKVAAGQKAGEHAAVQGHAQPSSAQADAELAQMVSGTKLPEQKPKAALEAKPTTGSPIPADATFYHYGKHQDATTLQPLTFFSSDKKSAESYEANGKGQLHEVKLSIKNPATASDVIAAAKAVGFGPEDAGMPDDESIAGFEYLSPHLLGMDGAKKVMAKLQSQGFDGAKFSTDFDAGGNLMPGGSVVIFDSSQVKAGGAQADKPAEAEDKAEQGKMDASKQGQAAPAESSTSGLAMPAFKEGKTVTGVVAHYEKVAQKILDMAADGDAAGLAQMKTDGLQPNSKGKVSNTWNGKTANSKMLLALHATALEQAGGAPAAEQVKPADPKPAAPAKPPRVVAAKPKAAPATAKPSKAEQSDPLSDWVSFSSKHWGDVNEVSDANQFLADPKSAGPAALSAYGAGGFLEINNAPSSPIATALLSYIEKLPSFDADEKLHRVMGFDSQKDVDGFLSQLQPAADTPSSQAKTVSSWTTTDPTAPGQTPMNNIALDLAEQFGPHKVFLTLEPGHKSAKDVSFLYSPNGKTKSGLDVLLPHGVKLDVVSIKKNGLKTHVVVREVHEGDTKPGADGGTLVLKNGHWVKQGGDAPAAVGDVFKLDSQYQKMNAGEWTVYNVSPDGQQVYMHKVGAKVPNQTNSATIPAATLAEAIAKGTAKKVPAAEAPKPDAAPAAEAAPVPASQAQSNLSMIPWDKQLLPDSNSNAGSHNKAINKIKAMAEAGDTSGLQAFIDKKAGAKQTYAKKQHLLAQTALAALNEGDATVEVKPAAATAPMSLNELKQKLFNASSSEEAQSLYDQFVKESDPKLKGAALDLVHSVGWGTVKGSSAAANPAPAKKPRVVVAKPAAKPAPSDAAPAAKAPLTKKVQAQVFHNTTPGHNKFWSISVNGNLVKTLYGKIGSKGVSTVNSYASPEAAQAAAQKIVATKKKGGYVDAGSMDHNWLAPDAGGSSTQPQAPAEPTGPKDGDTKQGADGMLVFKDGRWHKQGEKSPAQDDKTALLDGWKAAIAAGKVPTKEQADHLDFLMNDPDGDPDLVQEAFEDAVNESVDHSKYASDDELMDAAEAAFSNAQALHEKALLSEPSAKPVDAKPVDAKTAVAGVPMPKLQSGTGKLKYAKTMKLLKETAETEGAEGLSKLVKLSPAGHVKIYGYLSINPDGSKYGKNAELMAQYAKALYQAVVGAGAAAGSAGPKEGDTKPGANGGTLILKDGHWVKMGGDDSASWNYKKNDLGFGGLNTLMAEVDGQGVYVAYEPESKTFEVGTFTDDGDPDSDNFVRPKEVIDYLAQKFGTSLEMPSLGQVEKLTGKVSGKKYVPDMPSELASVSSSEYESMEGWTQTGPQGGSNPGGRFRDKDGVEWYCKFPLNLDLAKAEVLAAKLYTALGLSAQDCKLVVKDGKVAIASRWVDVKKAGSAAALSKIDGVASGFAADAWLANWDVVGMQNDNLLVGSDGKAHRVDAGGSLMYRAQGGKKVFGDSVIEIDSLRDPKVNPQAAAVFGKLSKSDITASVAKVLALPDSEIIKLVNLHGPGTAEEKQALAKTLIARKADLAAKFPSAKKEKKKPVFDASKISAPPDFLNWGGSGKSGPSSKEFLNQANHRAAQYIHKAAQTGDVAAVTAINAPIYDKNSGAVTGKALVLDHPSQHIKGYAQQVINEINYQMNPPKQFRFDGGHPLHSLNASYPPFVGSLQSSAVSKAGKFVVLGDPGTLPLDVLGLPKITHQKGQVTPQTYAAEAQSAIAKMPQTQRQAVKAYTGSGYQKINSSLWDGNPSGQAKAAAEALHTLAHDIAPGTVLSRKLKVYNSNDLNKILGSTGKILQEPAIMSTSIRPSSWSGNVQLKLHVGPGVKGLWVGNGSLPGGGALSIHSSEDEMILPPNTRLLILSVKESKGTDSDGFGDGVQHIIEAVVLPSEGY